MRTGEKCLLDHSVPSTFKVSLYFCIKLLFYNKHKSSRNIFISLEGKRDLIMVIKMLKLSFLTVRGCLYREKQIGSEKINVRNENKGNENKISGNSRTK